MAKLAKLVARAEPVLRHLSQGAVMVEIGIYAADLACYILERRPDVTWHGVDSWLGADRQPAAYLATGDVHASLAQSDQDRLRLVALDRLRPHEHRATVHHMDSVEASWRFARESVDLCFIDGDHSKEGTARDIAAWWPKVKSGGWLGGHDYLSHDRRFTFGVNLAVNEFVRDQRLKLVLDNGTTWWVKKPVTSSTAPSWVSPSRSGYGL